MREIEFRGSFAKNKWVYGYYYSECDNCYIIENSQKQSMLSRQRTVRCIPETIGQYSGLKDKNGVKVFENDIVSCDNGDYEFRAIIEWDGFGWDLWNISENMFERCIKDYQDSEVLDVEVIGNIHEVNHEYN